MAVPFAFAACFEVSTIRFDLDVKESSNVARLAARTLIDPLGALTAKKSHIMLYDTTDGINRDQ